MLFQELTANDEAGILEMSAMATAIVREHYDPILGKAQNDYMLEKFQSVPALRDQLAHGYRYFFARSGEGRNLGFLAFYPRPGALYLSKLYLYREARGRGYARIMLDFLRTHAEALGLSDVELNVNRFNPTVGIYEKLGFRRIREEKNDIGHGYFMDDYVYRLELRPKGEHPMNDVIRAMIERRSVRSFRPDMPPEQDIEQIIQAGLYAASSRGKQGTIIVSVTNAKLRERLVRDNRAIGGWDGDFDPFYGAPVILIVLGDKSSANRVYDGSLVMGNLMLAAHSLGLGSIWIHRAKEEFEMPGYKALLHELGISGEWEGIGHCAIGYPAAPLPPPPPRKEHRVFRVN